MDFTDIFASIQAELLAFTRVEVEKFLARHDGAPFYAFAYDCNAEYAEVNLCFNTEAAFAATLKAYKDGPYGHHYQTEEAVTDLRYSTGDWDYQCFASTYLLSHEDLQEIFNSLPDDDYKSWLAFCEQLMGCFIQALTAFSQTPTFAKIPKTENFRFFCIDHDEDFADAEARMKKHQEDYGSDSSSSPTLKKS